jgi:hypothetical protein
VQHGHDRGLVAPLVEVAKTIIMAAEHSLCR